ncbi:aldehyde dehydrogenase family protein [Ilumatobacter coccineus]|uniref:Aldehyde dehydrogenase n=1 Tax=Ilumatobacter coccineus (strain NBRC 103263 / KCTC 29153 / YM16-304) TaxID=1313172 RepID=A0A6C7EAX5_ILUCY|nr:aldehyde dehydrogenase family protein [Ilumatobacter coccineus]BAN03473.1 aldehyde dehydrogenase [Ilumatobacter coccineus YM16-304]
MNASNSTTTDGTAASGTRPFDASAIVRHARYGFERGLTRSMTWRQEQLSAMADMLRDNSDRFIEALAHDLHKPATEAWVTEIGFTLSDIEHQKKHLEKWAKPRKVKVPLAFQPASARIVPEPKGVVLIIAPWNYPLQLLLSPMAAAIAAGNAIVAKPSELAPATSAVLTELCAKYLDTSTITVVEGAADESSALLEERFDHIFFTGGTRVGKIVMRAAAEHLTPVTLELGGKSPAIVAADADVEVTARRIAWGKFVNSGQTCIAPDYVLVARPLRDRLVAAIEASVTDFYGDDPRASDDYGRIVSDGHFQRIAGLIDGDGSGIVAFGGTTDASERFIAPTVLVDPDVNSDIMSEEIFGPVLPVIAVDTIDEAIDFVNDREKPLALYVFTDDEATAERTVARTSSGGVSVNSTLLHIGPPELPFGGVGPSGMGAYHGIAGFETFSHLKSVFDKRTKPDLKVMYPPYSGLKERLLKLVQ